MSSILNEWYVGCENVFIGKYVVCMNGIDSEKSRACSRNQYSFKSVAITQAMKISSVELYILVVIEIKFIAVIWHLSKNSLFIGGKPNFMLELSYLVDYHGSNFLLVHLRDLWLIKFYSK